MTENVFGDYEAGQVNLERTAVRNMNATAARLERSAVQRLHSDSLTADRSAFGFVNASTAELKESAAGIVAGDYVRVEEGSVMFLLAPRVSGNVKAVLTLPSALAIGAGLAVGGALIKALLGRSGRK